MKDVVVGKYLGHISSQLCWSFKSVALPGDVGLGQIINMKTIIFDTIAGVLGWVDLHVFLR